MIFLLAWEPRQSRHLRLTVSACPIAHHCIRCYVLATLNTHKTHTDKSLHTYCSTLYLLRKGCQSGEPRFQHIQSRIFQIILLARGIFQILLWIHFFPIAIRKRAKFSKPPRVGESQSQRSYELFDGQFRLETHQTAASYYLRPFPPAVSKYQHKRWELTFLFSN